MICPRALLPFALAAALAAQSAADTSAAPALQSLAPNLARLSGVEPTSGITYVRIFLVEDPPPNTTPAFDLSRPTLTAQCTQDKKGKLHFEIFVNFGAASPTQPITLHGAPSCLPITSLLPPKR